MKQKKFILDKMIKKGIQLEYPYFWYLENMSLDNLVFLLENYKKGVDK